MPARRAMSEAAFRRNLRWVFSMAEEMCGSHHPDYMDEDRREVQRTKREVHRRLRGRKS